MTAWSQVRDVLNSAPEAALRKASEMKIGSAFPSSYLKQEDLGTKHVLVTIDKVEIEDVGQDDEKETKPVIYFRGASKGMALNRTNAATISDIIGTDETDDWVGKKIVLYVDKNIMFGGKRVGGIRVTAPPKDKNEPPPPPPVVEEITEGFQASDDDVPF